MAADYDEWRHYAQIFVGLLMDEALLGSADALIARLEDTTTNRRTHPDVVKRRAWFQALDEQSQDYIRGIVNEACYSAIFQCLGALDNKATATQVPGRHAEYLLFMELSKLGEKDSASQDKILIRLNPQGHPVGELHDLLAELAESIPKGPEL